MNLNLVLAAGLVLSCTAMPAFGFTDADYAAAMSTTARNVIIPYYRGFEAATAALQVQIAALCEAPAPAHLDEARAAFAAIAQTWAGLQFLTLGPISEHQRAFRIEYWPDKRNVVGRQLADVLAKQDAAALEQERFATTTVGVQGLPAMERLLFDDNALQQFPKDAPGAAFRCSLMAAIGDNLQNIATDVLTEWTAGEKPYLARIEQPDADDEEMPSARDAAARLLNDLLTATIAMRDMKLLAPLGDSLRKAKPQVAEFWRSGQSIAMLSANLAGMRASFGIDQGLGGLLSAQPEGKATAAALIAALDQASSTLGSITLPLDKAVADPAQRKQVEALAEQLEQTRDLLAGPVATKLNLPIGFNALDGD